ncbi:MAG: hypothetical protein MK105_04725 [Crocinitomicaceae bacterium]|nr:hypothetical protein [Crocinitomicaceae bacterium]
MLSKGRYIDSSALGYALSFLLLIGMVCSGAVFISSVYKRESNSYQLDEHMLFNNYLSLKIGAQAGVSEQQSVMHISGDTSKYSKKSWGGFEVVNAITQHKNRVVQKSVMIGSVAKKEMPCLYLPDYRQAIKLCGETKIEGDVYMSKRGFERGHISGAPFSGDKLIYGKQLRAKKSLPNLKDRDFDILNELKNGIDLDNLPQDSTFSFMERTTVFRSNSSAEITQNLQGNILLFAKDSLVIKSSASLRNVLLVAPVIRFEKGFTGNVQAIAEHRIVCEERVFLKYPSTLILNEKSGAINRDQSKIELKNNAKVLGGVLLTSEHPNYRRQVHLDVQNAFVAGLIYNQGETQFIGELVGSLYTSKLILNHGGGTYSGHLLNAKISNRDLPKDFALPNWFEKDKNAELKFIACI